jgi:alkylation response protein AidB-like acyl-CoA dehydrogenase
VLDGVAPIVPDARIADFAIVACGEGSALQLGIVDLAFPQVTIADRPSLDPCHRFGDIAFSGARFERLGELPPAPALEAARDSAAVLAAFEQVGGADRAIEMARNYALERRAFGRPIGSFQAIKHMLADMFVATELARSNAYYAAWALASGSDQLPLAAATARVSATRAYELCAANAIQVHGGIGFTAEMDCHLHYRRSSGLAHALGSVAFWEDRLVRELDRQAG